LDIQISKDAKMVIFKIGHHKNIYFENQTLENRDFQHFMANLVLFYVWLSVC